MQFTLILGIVDIFYFLYFKHLKLIVFKGIQKNTLTNQVMITKSAEENVKTVATTD